MCSCVALRFSMFYSISHLPRTRTHQWGFQKAITEWNQEFLDEGKSECEEGSKKRWKRIEMMMKVRFSGSRNCEKVFDIFQCYTYCSARPVTADMDVFMLHLVRLHRTVTLSCLFIAWLTRKSGELVHLIRTTIENPHLENLLVFN